MLPMDLDDAGARTRAVADRTIAMLRSGIRGDASVPGLDWTAGECAAHLVTVFRAAARLVAGDAPPVSSLADIAALNEQRLRDLPERDPPRLAALLDHACQDYLDRAAPLTADHPIAWYEPEVLPLGSVTSVLLAELVVHGRDIASAVARDWPVERGDALAVAAGALRLLPAYVDPRRAAGCDSRYELRLRGGPRVGLAFADGRLTVEEPVKGPVDCHLSADPAAFLLVTYGRQSVWSGVVRGQLVAWGRRPWLGLRITDLFVRP